MKAEELASKIDHTCLKPDAKREDIKKLCSEAMQFGFYSVCIHGAFLDFARKELASSSVKLCSVVGFPLGANLTASKAYETKLLIEAGCHEIDMVLNISALKDGDEIQVQEDIEAVLQEARSCPLKVIIETALLSEAEKILACEIVVRAGAQYVKTSTGFASGGAQVEDVKLIRKHVGSSMGVKASGGISSYKTAVAMIEAGASRLGCSKSVEILQEAKSNEV